jgi:hypothetical protein
MRPHLLNLGLYWLSRAGFSILQVMQESLAIAVCK